MAIELRDLVDLFQEFLESDYIVELQEAAAKGVKAISIDFFRLAKFRSEAAEQLLDDPDNTLKALEEAAVVMGFKVKARFKNLPDSQQVFIRNVRAEHLGRLISITGIIRQSSDVSTKSYQQGLSARPAAMCLQLSRLMQNSRSRQGAPAEEKDFSGSCQKK